MTAGTRLLRHVAGLYWRRWLAIALGFLLLYQVGLLLATMARFRQFPNYVQLYDVIGSYRLIIHGTPAWSDVWPIVVDEPWLELGFKDPRYYGVATWSYLLIPPKMLVVFVAGGLLAAVLMLARAHPAPCRLSPSRAFAVAAVGSGFVGLSSATLTWVVCCATPSWTVALTMLGMSASVALRLNPFGTVLSIVGLLLLAGVVAGQLRQLAVTGSDRP